MKAASLLIGALCAALASGLPLTIESEELIDPSRFLRPHPHRRPPVELYDSPVIGIFAQPNDKGIQVCTRSPSRGPLGCLSVIGPGQSSPVNHSFIRPREATRSRSSVLPLRVSLLLLFFSPGDLSYATQHPSADAAHDYGSTSPKLVCLTFLSCIPV